MAKTPTLISGSVRDPGGHPVEGARVYFKGGPVPLQDTATLTGSDGEFSLAAPVPGDYTIECAAEGFLATSTHITVESTQDKIVEIYFKK